MTPPTVLLVCDAHLGPDLGPGARAFHAFVDQLSGPETHLVINGDLFEFWFEYDAVIPSYAFQTLVRLANARARGVRLTLIGGNHDRWHRHFWERELSAAFYPHQAELVLQEFRALVVHGDGVTDPRPADRILHTLIRHRWVTSTFRWVHPDLGYRLAWRLSRGLRHHLADAEELRQAAAAQAVWAHDMLRQRPDLDLVVMGHTHAPRLEVVAERRWYLNPGAWFDGFRYAVISPEGPSLRQFSPPA